MATTAPRQTPPPADTEPGLGGWVLFAALMLVMAASFSLLYGLAAVLNDKVVTVGGSGGVIVADFTTWGWVHMALGVVMLGVAFGLFATKGWARWTAIAIATINAITQLTIITAFPIWALIVVALDVTIIYQLTVNWNTSR
jgi:hypothetical protein